MANDACGRPPGYNGGHGNVYGADCYDSCGRRWTNTYYGYGCKDACGRNYGTANYGADCYDAYGRYWTDPNYGKDLCGRPKGTAYYGSDCTDSCGRYWTDPNFRQSCAPSNDSCGRPAGHVNFGAPCYDSCGRYWTAYDYGQACTPTNDSCGRSPGVAFYGSPCTDACGRNWDNSAYGTSCTPNADPCGRLQGNPDFNQPCTDACNRFWTSPDFNKPCTDFCGRPVGHPDYDKACQDACGRNWNDAAWQQPCFVNDACGRAIDHPQYGNPCLDDCGRYWTDPSYGTNCHGQAGPLVAGSLGCGEYNVFLARRGTGILLAEIPWTSLSYSRTLNDASSCSVTVSEPQECCDVLSQVNPFATEIVIFRDGEQVWVGPVVEQPSVSAEGSTISARDLFQIFERRVFYYNVTFSNTELTQIFTNYALAALAPDLSSNITLVAVPTLVKGTRELLGRDFTRIADEMRELTRTGMDFTMINRTFFYGDLTKLIPTTPLKIWEQSVAEASLAKQGLALTTQWIVTGQRYPDIDGFPVPPPTGIAGGPDPEYGLLVQVQQEDSILDDESAQAAAESRLRISQGVTRSIDVKLAPEAPFGFPSLIPGRLGDVRLQIGCDEVLATMRMDSIDVSASVSDSGITESVSAKLLTQGPSG